MAPGWVTVRVCRGGRMAWAVCRQCGADVHWPARRGARLADQRCPTCWGGLRARTSGHICSAKGRQFERCVICQRRGLRLLHPVYPFRKRFAVRDSGCLGRLYPAGSPVCGTCEPVPILCTHDWEWDASVLEAARGLFGWWGNCCNLSGHAPSTTNVAALDPTQDAI